MFLLFWRPSSESLSWLKFSSSRTTATASPTSCTRTTRWWQHRPTRQPFRSPSRPPRPDIPEMWAMFHSPGRLQNLFCLSPNRETKVRVCSAVKCQLCHRKHLSRKIFRFCGTKNYKRVCCGTRYHILSFSGDFYLKASPFLYPEILNLSCKMI